MLIRSILNSVVVFAVLIVAAGTGCASKPAEIAPQATTALESLRTQLFTAKAQVQDASNAARDLLQQPRADLTAQMQRLNTVVTALNGTREKARAEAQSYQEKSAEYFAKWDETLKSMSEDTAWRGEKRLALAKESVARLRQDATDIRANINPFMADINEANKYLSTDTTKSGLDVIRPKLKSAADRESAITKSIDKAIADIDAIRAGK